MVNEYIFLSMYKAYDKVTDQILEKAKQRKKA